MKLTTKAWLESAKMDLDNILFIIDQNHLTPVVAFHSQQAIEKTFKAVLEEYDVELKKTHDLIHLYEMIRTHINFNIEIEELTTINELYIDARYPGELGILPKGNPTVKDVHGFYELASSVFQKVNVLITAKK